MVAGSVSIDGLAALTVKISRKKNQTSEVTQDSKERSISHVDEQD
jgi:hypothetical protein